ncbi:MAG: CHAT domain-containing protein, partial [Caldilineaceae bacterium]|nr:CHAT domain-containing protein [Caldilineaceae bacterium]
MFDFDLRVDEYDAGSGALRVAVAASPAGEVDPTPSTAPPISLAQALAADDAGLRTLATTFTQAVLPSPIWTCWRESIGRAGAAGLRLRVRTSDAAASLPWELLYDAAHGSFLALDPATPVVRYLEGPIAAPLLSAPATVRALVTSASAPAAQLFVDRSEVATVAAALSAAWPGRCQVTQIAQLTPALLQERLMLLKPHIFHFAGHATAHPDAASHILVLAAAGGYIDPLDEKTLAALLGAAQTRLVMLNACVTAEEGAERWSGLAQQLVRGGVPAVVAMHTTIDDDLAVRFAHAFYRALAAGDALDVAATQGRLALLQAGGPNRANVWLVPALFTRLTDARLWPTPTTTMTAASALAAAGPAINKVEAGVFVQGDATIDVRGSSFHFGSTRRTDDPVVMDRLDALERTILARFERTERAIVAQTLAGLDERQRALVDELLGAVTTQPARAEGEALLAAVAALRAGLRAQGMALSDQLD